MITLNTHFSANKIYYFIINASELKYNYLLKKMEFFVELLFNLNKDGTFLIEQISLFVINVPLSIG